MPAFSYHVAAWPWYVLFLACGCVALKGLYANHGGITCSALGSSRAHAYVDMLTRGAHIAPAPTTEMPLKTWGFALPYDVIGHVPSAGL